MMLLATMFKASVACAQPQPDQSLRFEQLKESIEDEISYVKSWYNRNYNHLCDVFYTKKTTGNIDIVEETKADGIFTLDGRRVEKQDYRQLAKGIYIVNGKKTVVR